MNKTMLSMLGVCALCGVAIILDRRAVIPDPDNIRDSIPSSDGEYVLRLGMPNFHDRRKEPHVPPASPPAAAAVCIRDTDAERRELVNEYKAANGQLAENCDLEF